MTDWKEEIAKIKGNIRGVHDAIAKYLELTGNPDRVPIDDLATVCQLTELFAPNIAQQGFEIVVAEFMVYHGFDPVPTEDGFYEKLPSKRVQRA